MSASPIFAALPAGLAFTEYESDGDVSMTDLPIYATPPRVAMAMNPPPAPVRISRMDAEQEEDAAMPPFIYARGDGPPPFVLPPEVEAPPPGGEPEQEAGWGHQDPVEEEWYVSVGVPDLALRLDFRHPRVLLHFFRFVSTYNELAPRDEEIHLPAIPRSVLNQVYAHPGLGPAAPEFEQDVAELRHLLQHYSCLCAECDTP